MNRYLYSVVRYVPNVASGEFVGVGVIVVSHGESHVRWVTNPQRAYSFGDPKVVDAVLEFVRGIADRDLTEAVLDKLHKTLQRTVTLSPPAPILAKSVADAMDVVFAELIRE